MKILFLILGLFIIWQVIIRLVRKLFHFPAPAFLGYFLDSTLRKKFQPPEKVVKRSEIKKGTDVLEVGCGSGAFTTCAARAVGKDGKVYALDIEPKMLKQLENKLNKPKNQDIKNVKLVKGSACNLPFKNKSLDLVFMATVLQEIPNKNKALKEIRRVLKPGGILAVTEFLPDPDYPFKSTTIKLGNRAGFVLDNVSGSFWNYTVRFVNPPSQG